MLFSFANVSPAHAAVGIVVNSDADSVGTDGACTLREAIDNANSDSDTTGGDCAAGTGGDSITFATDYTITLDGSQLPVVTSEMTITGKGAGNTIIQANVAANTATYRVFEVTSTGNLTLDGVTVRHGRCAGGCNTYNIGGGILNYGGTLTVINSTLSGNSAGSNSIGGGIANTSYADLAHIFHQAMLTVTNSTLSGNSAGNGGGIANEFGLMTVTGSTFSGNYSGTNGGGIYNRGTLSVTDSTLSGNTANTYGGGISNEYGMLTVTNSTFSGNSINPSIVNGGGGIANLSSTLTVNNSTFTGNSVTPTFIGGGGGIYNSGGTLTVTDSILSGNNSTTPSISGGGDEVYSTSIPNTAFNVLGHNGQINAEAFFGFSPGANDFNATFDGGGIPTALASILDTALADNGGPTQTHALVAGSPAIDFAGACGLATDQRGVVRPQGACDAGAFELVTNQPPTAVAGGPYLVAAESSVAFDGSGSSDPDGDALTETWTADGGTVAGANYTAGAVPGIYDVCLTVNDGTVDSADCTIVVVYDPSAGFVTGGGWIESPAGAYTADETLTGKATFGFVAKYKKGANVPDGNTSFAFDLAGLEFYSDSYEWLVVNQGGTNAQFRGSGTVNGALDLNGNPYKFMLWAGDGPDTFRIRIWSEDANGIETVLYDNGFGQPIGAGNIVVHTGK